MKGVKTFAIDRQLHEILLFQGFPKGFLGLDPVEQFRRLGLVPRLKTLFPLVITAQPEKQGAKRIDPAAARIGDVAIVLDKGAKITENHWGTNVGEARYGARPCRKN